MGLDDTAQVLFVRSWETGSDAIAATGDGPLVVVDCDLNRDLPSSLEDLVCEGRCCAVRSATQLDLADAALVAARVTATEAVEVLDVESGARQSFEPVLQPDVLPGVSVLIPMYQAGAYAAQAIDGVFAQTVSPVRLVVIDDGSTDDSAVHALAALRACPAGLDALLVRMPHRGQAASRNTGLALAGCEWVYYLDADDVPVDRALEALLWGARANPDAAMICSKCIDFISPELSEEEAAQLKTNPQPYVRMLAGCLLVKRELYDLVGTYDESLPSSETAQWMLRAKDAGARMACIDDVTLRRRYHRNNFGRRDRKTQLKSYMQIIKQRRAQRGE